MILAIRVIAIIIFVELPFALADHLLKVFPRGVIHIQEVRGDVQPAIAAPLLSVVNPAAALGVTQETMQQPDAGGNKRERGGSLHLLDATLDER